MSATKKSNRSSASSSRPSSKPSASNARKPAAKKVPSRGNAQLAAQADSRVKNDIVGILICAVAVALFIAVIIPSNALVTKAVASGLRYGFGIGAFVLPFPLLIWGAGFFFREGNVTSTARFGLGLALIFIALIALFSTCSPEAEASLKLLFLDSVLIAYGGYVGSGIAWVLMSLMGKIIAIVLLVALVLVGLVVIGFSVTGLVERVRTWWSTRDERRAAKEEAAEQRSHARVERGMEESAPQGLKALPAAETHRLDAGLDARAAAGFIEAGSAAPATTVMAGKHKRARASSLPFVEDEPQEALAAVTEADWNDRVPLIEADEGFEPSETLATRRLPRRKKGGEGGERASRKTREPLTRADTEVQGNAATSGYQLPDFKVLKVSGTKASSKAAQQSLEATARHLQGTLDEFSVDGEVVGWVAGPQATLYKIDLQAGVRLNRITNLAGDIALSLAAAAVRIVAPIPGTSLVGVEVPNTVRASVLLGDVLPSHGEVPTPLLLGIGKDVEGNSITADLASMPHLLIGGSTGSGKSVAINSFIMSMLMRSTPEEVRMILIDPKRVELSLYNGIPHLYVPVVTDAEKAATALSWGVAEMERRLKLFEKAGARNITQFNEMMRFALEREAAAAEEAADGSDVPEGGGASGSKGSAAKETLDTDEGEMPHIVIVIDELADLMMVCGKDVETSISRISQLARAAGIHLIVATQRPSTNVITGLIKANIINRIAFTVASGIDSSVILDTRGAEDLIGKGDLLFSKPEYAEPLRVQGCYVGETEINTVVEFIRKQGEPDYHEEIFAQQGGSSSGFGDANGPDDPLMWEAAEIVVSSNLGSTSALQRRLKVGYARAGRIMDMLEAHGIVGPPNGSKPRDVLVDELELESLKAFEAADGEDW